MTDNKVRIVSGGDSSTSAVFVGDRGVPGVVKIEWCCGLDEFATAVIHVIDVDIDAALPADRTTFLSAPTPQQPDPEEQP